MWQRLSRGAGANALGQFIIILLQLFQVPVFSSHWGVQQYGVWIMLSTVPSYLAFSDLGFGRTATIDMTMKVAVDDYQGALRVYQSAAVLIFGAIAVIVLIAAGLVGVAALLPHSVFDLPGISTQARTALMLLVVYGLIALGGSLMSSPLQATGNYAVDATYWALAYGAEGAAVLCVVITGGGMVATAATMVLMRTLATLATYRVARRRAPWCRFGFREAHRDEIRIMLRPALAMMSLPVANGLVLQGTAMAIGLGAVPGAVPAFTAIRALSRVPMQISGTLVRAMMPEFSAAIAMRDGDRQARLMSIALLASTVTLVPFALGLCLFGQWFIRFWSHGVITSSEPTLVVMAVVLILNGLWTPLSNIVIAANKQDRFTYFFLGLGAVGAVAAYLLAHQFGTIGGPLALLMVDGLMLLRLRRVTAQEFGAAERLAVTWRRSVVPLWARLTRKQR